LLVACLFFVKWPVYHAGLAECQHWLHTQMMNYQSINQSINQCRIS
jgi:hypothetical protein